MASSAAAASAPTPGGLGQHADRPVELVRDGATAEAPAGLTAASARPQVAIGPFSVCDMRRDDVVAAVVAEARASAGVRPFTAFALHVGGLNVRNDQSYVDAMAAADLVYADGASIVLAARVAGAQSIERCATTDIGWSLLDKLHEALGRPVRVALVGGTEGLARRAGEVIEQRCAATVVFAEHGYHSDWSDVLDTLRTKIPDIVVVGLGAPAEMMWAVRHHADLPPCLVLTCGGWFGFIAGDELRAPALVQRLGLEWVYRLAQAPRRLARRYSIGLISLLQVMGVSIARRARRAATPVATVPAQRSAFIDLRGHEDITVIQLPHQAAAVEDLR